MSSPSGRSGSYTGLIGFNPRRLKGLKTGMSSHATDLSIYAKSSSSSRLAQDSWFHSVTVHCHFNGISITEGSEIKQYSTFDIEKLKTYW